ncbi:MAG: DNA-processing protein DprA [Lautropia sp.]|nr:DNA-processing protein DprA [Lautropia sp.]
MMPSHLPTAPSCAERETTEPRWQQDDDSLASWLKLAHSAGIGPVRGQQLLRHLGSPDTIFQTAATTLRALLGQPRLVSALLGPDPARDRAIEQALSWQSRQPNRFLLTLDDPRYPPALLHLADPPLVLYAEGDLDALSPPALGIVGSRRATQDGRHNAFGFAEALARRGIVIVSGLAEGIDRAAHDGALAGATAREPATIAALGSGIDRIYPSHHRPLAARIIEHHGLLISEQPPGSAPMRANFPRRNRMIAALSRGVLLVEAALQSGSLITARLAAEIGRDVMAVPGSIHNPLSRGCHQLIRQGAALVECVDDILHSLGMSALQGTPPPRSTAMSAGPQTDTMQAAHPALPDAGPCAGSSDSNGLGTHADNSTTGAGAGQDDDPAQRILQVLAVAPLPAEGIARQLGWPIDKTLVQIQLLELAGQLERHLDGRWQRRRA